MTLKKHDKGTHFGNRPGPPSTDAANPIPDRVFGLKTLRDVNEMQVQVQGQRSVSTVNSDAM